MKIRVTFWAKLLGLFTLFTSSAAMLVMSESRRNPSTNSTQSVIPKGQNMAFSSVGILSTLQQNEVDQRYLDTGKRVEPTESDSEIVSLLNHALEAYSKDNFELYQQTILNPQVLEKISLVRMVVFDEQITQVKHYLRAFPQFLKLRLPYMITRDELTYLTIWEFAAIEGKITVANYLEQRLIQQKVDVDIYQNDFTQTLDKLLTNHMEISPYTILIAAAKGWDDAVALYRKYLIDGNQADLDPISKVPLTFLALGRLKEYPQMRLRAFKTLLAFVDPNLSMKFEKRGHQYLAPGQEVSLNQGLVVEQSLLDVCVGNNFNEETRELLKRRARTDLVDELGLFPIDVAAMKGNWPIVFAMLEYGHPVTKANRLGNKFFDTLVSVAHADSAVLKTLVENPHTKKYVPAIQKRLHAFKYERNSAAVQKAKRYMLWTVQKDENEEGARAVNKPLRQYMR